MASLSVVQLPSEESDDDSDDVLTAKSVPVSVASYCDPEARKRPQLRPVRRRHAGRSDTSSYTTVSAHGSGLESVVRVSVNVIIVSLSVTCFKCFYAGIFLRLFITCQWSITSIL